MASDLPRVGTRFEFRSGDVVLQSCGVCEVIAAEPRPHAAGRIGGRVWFRANDGEESTVTLSYYKEHAHEIAIPPDTNEPGYGG